MARNSAKVILPARPLGLGDVVSAAFKVLGARFWFSLGIGALYLASILIISILPYVIVGISITATGNPQTLPAGLTVVVVVLTFLAPIVTIVLNVRLVALIARLTKETAEGYRPTFGDLWGATRGVVRRALPLIAILFGAILALSLVFTLLVGSVILAAGDGSFAGAAVAVLVLAFFVIWAGGIFASVRLYPLLPVLALESHSGIGSVKRAWSLTSGRFFRTVGFWLVAGAIAYAGLIVISFINLIVGLLVGFNLPTAGQIGTPPEITAAAIAALLIVLAVSMVGTGVILIFGVGYQTVYYIDLARRDEFATAQAAGGYAAAGHGVGDPDVASSWGAGPEPGPSGELFDGPSGPGTYDPDPSRPGSDDRGPDSPDSYRPGTYNPDDRGSGHGLGGEQR